jgi:hypothetical protein
MGAGNSIEFGPREDERPGDGGPKGKAFVRGAEQGVTRCRFVLLGPGFPKRTVSSFARLR